MIVSSSYCKLYSTDGNHTRPIMPLVTCVQVPGVYRDCTLSTLPLRMTISDMSSIMLGIAESCTLIDADNGEAAYIEKTGSDSDDSDNYDKYSDTKCSESNIGTYDDDDCEERCDDNSECGAFVIVSSSYCKLYGECTCPGQNRPPFPRMKCFASTPHDATLIIDLSRHPAWAYCRELYAYQCGQWRGRLHPERRVIKLRQILEQEVLGEQHRHLRR